MTALIFLSSVKTKSVFADYPLENQSTSGSGSQNVNPLPLFLVGRNDVTSQKRRDEEGETTRKERLRGRRLKKER